MFSRVPIEIVYETHSAYRGQCDYGDGNGTAAAQLLARRGDHLDEPYPRGESWRQAVVRVGRFLGDLPVRWSGQRVLVIGHVGVAGTLVLDAEGLVKLASGDPRARHRFEAARKRRGRVVTAAPTLAEVLRGGPRDTNLHSILRRMTVVAVDKQQGRAAGELLGRTGLSGHQCALDAILAVVALGQPRPVVLLTSDTDDMRRLTEEPGRPRQERIQVTRV
jgi:hypothetical protein